MTPSSVDTTVERLSSQAGKPRINRLIRRDDRIVAAFAVWCHAGGDFDLTGLQTAQIVLSLTGGQHAEIRGPSSYQSRDTIAGDVKLVVPRLSPQITIAGRAATFQIILADSAIAAGRECPGRSLNSRSLAAQALVASQSDTDDERCGSIAWQAARQIALRGFVHAGHARSPHARGGLAPQTLQRLCKLMRTRLVEAPDRLPDCDELARQASLSKFHFIRAFRDSTGLTPQAWMMERRIEHAFSLLLEGEARVGDVAERTGFSSPAHFVSTFRSRNGLTPAALRDAAAKVLAAAA